MGTTLPANENEKWIDENGNELKLVSYNFIQEKGSNRSTAYALLDDGTRIPYYKLVENYRRVGQVYINSKKSLFR